MFHECEKNTIDAYQIIEDSGLDVDPLGLADRFFAFKDLNDANLHSKMHS